MSTTGPDPVPRAVFRTSPLTILVAFAFAFCATPVALGGPYLWLLYLIPIGIIVWTLRVRTVAGHTPGGRPTLSLSRIASTTP